MCSSVFGRSVPPPPPPLSHQFVIRLLDRHRKFRFNFKFHSICVNGQKMQMQSIFFNWFLKVLAVVASLRDEVIPKVPNFAFHFHRLDLVCSIPLRLNTFGIRRVSTLGERFSDPTISFALIFRQRSISVGIQEHHVSHHQLSNWSIDVLNIGPLIYFLRSMIVA